MQQANNRALYLVILLLTAISFGSGFLVSRSQQKNSQSFDTTITVEHRYDSAIHHFSSNQLTVKKTDSTVYIVPQLDSVAIQRIIEKWFTHYYKIEVYRDNNLEATIADSIGQNQILNRAFSYKILRPDSTVYVTTASTQAKANFYPGVSACYLGTEGKPSIGPALFYSYQRLGIYAGAGLGQNPNINLGIHFKIKGK